MTKSVPACFSALTSCQYSGVRCHLIQSQVTSFSKGESSVFGMKQALCVYTHFSSAVRVSGTPKQLSFGSFCAAHLPQLLHFREEQCESENLI